MPKHLLITGGTGYLGSTIVKEFLLQKYKISVLIRPASSLFRLESVQKELEFILIDELDAFFEKNTVDGIIHLATNYGRKGEVLTEILDSNLVFPLRLLKLAIKHKVNFFINTDTSLPRDLNFYSLSKAQFRDWLLQLSNNIKIINIIPEYFYGPYDDSSKFVNGILHKLFENIESIDLTECIQKRDFIYIDDVVAAYSCVLENIEEVKEYTDIPLGTSNVISLKSLVKLMKELSSNTKTKLNFGKIPMRERDVMESKADISFLLSLGWKPKTEVKDGLIKIIKLQYNI